MNLSKQVIASEKPESIFLKPLSLDLKKLLTSVTKGVIHAVALKVDDVGLDALDAVEAIGLKTRPGELAYLLVYRSLTSTLYDLIEENKSRLSKKVTEESLKRFDLKDFEITFTFNKDFIANPGSIPLVGEVQQCLETWLTNFGIDQAQSRAIACRFKSYFTFSVNSEWKTNSKIYQPLLDQLNSPFADAADREMAWAAYSAFLERRIDESVFDEPFGLRQIYVSLRCYYTDDSNLRKEDESFDEVERRKRHVVDLQTELDSWLENPQPSCSIRVLSGGPGSGKSSFAKIYAAKVASSQSYKVLFIPLHLIDANKDLVSEVGKYVRGEGILIDNPLDAHYDRQKVLIIFDGLDELASQGKAANEIAKAFISEVETTVNQKNIAGSLLRVIFCGRELVVQDNESKFRKHGQILNILPYLIGDSSRTRTGRDSYADPGDLLKIDSREEWWKQYGELTGLGYTGLPDPLKREDLDEITSQPLLNYLIALSYSRGKLNFKEDINLNNIYADLVDAVYERGYEKHKSYGPISHLKCEEFVRVLEEIGLAAWHGDGRTTTIKDIKDHCERSGLEPLLKKFQEGAEAGVTRLLAAFFFRQHGQNSSGDPTFVFTHKSFGEYLAARRIYRAVEKIDRELVRRVKDLDEGWDTREAVKYWFTIGAHNPMTTYLFSFLKSEFQREKIENCRRIQVHFAAMFSYVLRNGSVIESDATSTFHDLTRFARNAEESMLATLNCCARCTGDISPVIHPSQIAFGAWFKNIQGQREGGANPLVSSCLSYLNLSGCILHIGDFYRADFSHSNLRHSEAVMACFNLANLSHADLTDGSFQSSRFNDARLVNVVASRTNFAYCDFTDAGIKEDGLLDSNIDGAIFSSTKKGKIVRR